MVRSQDLRPGKECFHYRATSLPQSCMYLFSNFVDKVHEKVSPLW